MKSLAEAIGGASVAASDVDIRGTHLPASAGTDSLANGLTGRDHPRSLSDYAASAWASTLLQYRRVKYFQNASNRRLS